jgi:hypothetical protein
MKTNMTESDKRLLTGMFLFVIIVAIGYWGILPQVKRYKALESKIEKEEDEKALNQLKIANLGLIEMQAEEYEQKISERKDEFYQIMKSSEIDKMMTEMATANHLDIYELNFTMPSSPTERMAYQYSALYQKQQEMKKNYKESDDDEDSKETKTSSDEDEEDEDSDSSSGSKKSSKSSTSKFMDEMMGAEEGGYQPNTDIYAVPVTMTVGGELEELEKFIDNIITMDKRVLLVGYSWGEFRDVIRRDANGNIVRETSGNSKTGEVTSSASSSANAETGDSSVDLSNTKVEVITRKSLTVRLEIYMCDTANIEASLNGSAEDGTSEDESSSEGETDESSDEGTTLDDVDKLLED